MKNIFTFILFIGLTIQAPIAWAQGVLEKVFEQSFDIGTEGAVEVLHRRGVLRVEEISGTQAKIKVVLKAEKGTAEAFQVVVDNFDLGATHNGNQLSVITDLNIRNYNSINGRTTIIFQNGDKVKGIKDLSADFLLQIPKVKALTVENKYEDIYLPDLKCDVSVKQYSADLIANDIDGNFDLAIKYGKAKVKNVGNTDMDIYDGGLEMGNANAVSLKSKYSKIKMGNLHKADLHTYDDNVTIGNINTMIDIVDKYSDFEMGNFQTGNWQIYDAAVIAGLVDKLILTSKYTEYKFDGVKTLTSPSLYEDELNIGSVGDFSCTSKYSEYNFGTLSGSVKMNSYEDELEVSEVLGTFGGLELSGKYTEVDMTIPSNVPYLLDVNMKYGEVEYAEDRFETSRYIDKNSIVEVKGKTKGATADAAKILVSDAYQCEIDLN